jgi:integral membrane protein
VTKLFPAYRILAITVGVFLLAATIDYLGHRINGSVPDLWWLWMIHGYFYMAYLVVAVPFTRRAGWSLGYIATVIVAGVIPGLMFYVEHMVSARYKAENPELFTALAA